MTRKAILSISVVIVTTLILAAILTATMPLWLIVLMISPRIIGPLWEKVSTRFALEMSRTMIRSMRGSNKTGVML